MRAGVKDRNVKADWKRQLREQCLDRIRMQREALQKRCRSGAARSSARGIIAALVAEETQRSQHMMQIESASVSSASSTSTLCAAYSPPAALAGTGLAGGAAGGMDLESMATRTARFTQGVERAALDDDSMGLSADEYIDLMTCLEEALALGSLGDGEGGVASSHVAPPLTDEEALAQHAAMEALELEGLIDAISAWDALAE